MSNIELECNRSNMRYQTLKLNAIMLKPYLDKDLVNMLTYWCPIDILRDWATYILKQSEYQSPLNFMAKYICHPNAIILDLRCNTAGKI